MSGDLGPSSSFAIDSAALWNLEYCSFCVVDFTWCHSLSLEWPFLTLEPCIANDYWQEE